jgi:hypothetical protein
MLIKGIEEFASTIPAAVEEKRGLYSIQFVVAERKLLLSKKRLTYRAQFRIDDEKRELRFTEMLKESGSGVSAGGDDLGPGFGFKKETYKTGAGPREGTLEEQSRLFAKDYAYTFDFASVRTSIEDLAAKAGYRFAYQLTARGL